MFCVVPSLNVPVAVNCCVSALGDDGIAGVTAIERSAAGHGQRHRRLAIAAHGRRDVVVPTPTPVARPAGTDRGRRRSSPTPRSTDVVMFCVVPSLNVPVAVNCCVAPWRSRGLGVTAIDARSQR